MIYYIDEQRELLDGNVIDGNIEKDDRTNWNIKTPIKSIDIESYTDKVTAYNVVEQVRDNDNQLVDVYHHLRTYNVNSARKNIELVAEYADYNPENLWRLKFKRDIPYVLNVKFKPVENLDERKNNVEPEKILTNIVLKLNKELLNGTGLEHLDTGFSLTDGNNPVSEIKGFQIVNKTGRFGGLTIRNLPNEIIGTFEFVWFNSDVGFDDLVMEISKLITVNVGIELV